MHHTGEEGEKSTNVIKLNLWCHYFYSGLRSASASPWHRNQALSDAAWDPDTTQRGPMKQAASTSTEKCQTVKEFHCISFFFFREFCKRPCLRNEMILFPTKFPAASCIILCNHPPEEAKLSSLLSLYVPLWRMALLIFFNSYPSIKRIEKLLEFCIPYKCSCPHGYGNFAQKMKDVGMPKWYARGRCLFFNNIFSIRNITVHASSP